MGDLAAEEVEFAGIVVHDRISLEAGDLAAIHIEGTTCVDFDGVVAVALRITILRDDLAGGLAAVGEGEGPVSGDADAGSIIVGVNNELVAVEAEADVGFIHVQRPSIVDGNVVEQIVVAAGLDGGEAVDTRPRCVCNGIFNHTSLCQFYQGRLLLHVTLPFEEKPTSIGSDFVPSWHEVTSRQLGER